MWVNLDKEMFIDGVLLVCIAICALSIALSFVPFQIHHDSTITLSYPQPSVSIQPVEKMKKEIVVEESAVFTAV